MKVLLSVFPIFEQTKAATVIILAGEGAGRLHSIADKRTSIVLGSGKVTAFKP